MSRLLLVRHGQIQSDNPARYWGHTDIPLNPEGVRQAEKLRERLAEERMTAIYSSNLIRALDTAAIIA
ncbi:MAG: histidine phosphatase family protein, partial [Dehalococcoidia bacterium]